MKGLYSYLFLLFFFQACTSGNHAESFVLKASDECISFPVPEDVGISQESASLFEDGGKTYLSFQNLNKNEILVYDFNSRRTINRVCIDTEGSNAVVGGFGGYLMTDLNCIVNNPYTF